MKIYTKTGDDGTTGLFGGARVAKSNERIHAYGTVDELNSYIGLIASFEVNKKRLSFLRQVQNDLFVIGSLLATDPSKTNLSLPKLTDNEATGLENEIDKLEASLPELKFFILPGGNSDVSFCHIARTICRRAERHIVQLKEMNEKVPENVVIYINRLSDYLFVLARVVAYELNVDEIPWKAVKS